MSSPQEFRVPVSPGRVVADRQGPRPVRVLADERAKRLLRGERGSSRAVHVGMGLHVPGDGGGRARRNPTGAASSSQRVPANTSSSVPPLSVVSVTTVPAGDVIVMSISVVSRVRDVRDDVDVADGRRESRRDERRRGDPGRPPVGLRSNWWGCPVTGGPQLRGGAGAEADAVVPVNDIATPDAMIASAPSRRAILGRRSVIRPPASHMR